jgi:hypothetical protein
MFASIKGLFLFGKVKSAPAKEKETCLLANTAGEPLEEVYKQKLSLVHYQQMNGMSFQEKVRKRMVPLLLRYTIYTE